MLNAKRSKASIRRKRPSWWTPEGVVHRLQNGEFVMDVCQAAASDMEGAGIEVSVRTLRSEISRWCESASWGEQLGAALALWKKNRQTGEWDFSKVWHDDFIAAMEVCEGNAQRAAAMIGVGYGVVLAIVDAASPHHDKEFSRRFKLAEMNRVAQIREKYLLTAEGDSKFAVRASEKVLAGALPDLHGKRSELNVTGKIEHEHEHEHLHQHAHLHVMGPDLAREVVMASQNRVRRINAGRDAGEPLSLPADSTAATIDANRVIELEPVRRAG